MLSYPRYHTQVPPPRPTTHLQASNPAEITHAAHLLRTGHTVAFPTETVYGLGANALSPTAVEQIFVAKQRPHWDPLIVHIADRNQLPEIAETNPIANLLIDAFWPGPLTLLLPRTQAIPDSVTAGRSLVGVRQPAHPVALALLAEAGVPIAAPSANTFGHTSPTTAGHVLDDLEGRIDAVLDAGPASVGVESTVAEATAGGIVVYRPGAITLAMLAAATGLPTTLYRANPSQAVQSLPSPGVGLRHYAPRARLILLDPAQLQAPTQLSNATQPIGIMLPEYWPVPADTLVFPWGPWDDLELLAARLFAGLRFLDEAGAQTILCPVPPGSGLAEAVRDRLEKAARKT